MKQRGFTLIELMIVIAIIGILLTFSVPAYQDHMIRTRVMEGLHIASAAKMAVVESYVSNQALPNNQDEAGYTSPIPSKYVQSVHIENQGVISIIFTQKAGNGTLLLRPQLQSDGEIIWSCTEGTLAQKYRPSQCRQ